MDNWMKCQPKCLNCEQNVFLRIILIKRLYRIGKSDILLYLISLGSAEAYIG